MRWLGDWSNENRRLTNPTVGLLCGYENEQMQIVRERVRGRREMLQVPPLQSVLRVGDCGRKLRPKIRTQASFSGKVRCGLQRLGNQTLEALVNCPHCGKRINVGKLLRSKRPTAAQKEAARLNGLKGGRPKAPKAKSPNAPAQPRREEAK